MPHVVCDGSFDYSEAVSLLRCLTVEEIKNGIFASTKYECGMHKMNRPHVIVFANFVWPFPWTSYLATSTSESIVDLSKTRPTMHWRVGS